MSNFLVTCATTENNVPCTLTDLVNTANNLAHQLITIAYPILLVVAGTYTFIRLLIDMNKPDALAKAKKNVGYIVWGSVFMLGAWGLMRVALSMVGWTGDISNPLGLLLSPLIETAYAAPFVNPSSYPNVQAMLSQVSIIANIIVGIAMALGLIYNGYQFIINSDNPGKLKEAKKWLGIILFGGMIFFSAKFLITTLMKTFTDIAGNSAPQVRPRPTAGTPTTDPSNPTDRPIDFGNSNSWDNNPPTDASIGNPMGDTSAGDQHAPVTKDIQIESQSTQQP